MESMSFGSISERGNAANEDFVFAAPGLGVLLDGASGLVPSGLFQERNRSLAQWFSHTAGSHIARELLKGSSVPDALESALESVRERLCEELGWNVGEFDSLVMETPDAALCLPSATVSIAQVSDNYVDVWWLGDSPIAVKTRVGIDVLSDEHLQKLDRQVLSTMVKRAHGRQLDASEKRDLVMDIVKSNRSLMNSRDGYYIFEPTGGGVSHICHKQFRRMDVESVVACSDGMFAAFETYGIASLAHVMRAPSEFCFREIIDRMRVVESEDPNLDRYVRLKRGDDASAFFLVL